MITHAQSQLSGCLPQNLKSAGVNWLYWTHLGAAGSNISFILIYYLEKILVYV